MALSLDLAAQKSYVPRLKSGCVVQQERLAFTRNKKD